MLWLSRPRVAGKASSGVDAGLTCMPVPRRAPPHIQQDAADAPGTRVCRRGRGRRRLLPSPSTFLLPLSLLLRRCQSRAHYWRRPAGRVCACVCSGRPSPMLCLTWPLSGLCLSVSISPYLHVLSVTLCEGRCLVSVFAAPIQERGGRKQQPPLAAAASCRRCLAPCNCILGRWRRRTAAGLWFAAAGGGATGGGPLTQPPTRAQKTGASSLLLTRLYVRGLRLQV